MTHPTADAQQNRLRHQACQVKMHYPELYAVLKQRDIRINRALSRIPAPADVESSSVFDLHTHIDGTLTCLPPGLFSLAEVHQEE